MRANIIRLSAQWDSAARQLQGCNSLEIVTIGTRHYIIAAGEADGGLSSYEIMPDGSKKVLEAVQAKVTRPVKEDETEDEEESDEPAENMLVLGSQWIRASQSGMYRSFTKLGSKVVKGQILGSISDPFGGREKTVKANATGYIICQNHAPLVNQGDALFHITTKTEDV